MTSSNRVVLSLCRETLPGTTPASPRMRKLRITGEGLTYTPNYVDSDEIRDDRMMGDPILVMKESGGNVNFELSFPADESPLSEIYRSAFRAPWSNTPQRLNDGVADSVITDIGTTANTITFATGAAFVPGQLVRTTGFAEIGNNGLFPVTTGGATSLVSTGAGFTAEAAPAAAARVKVVGLQGVAGDIAAVADGLTATALDFTTLGLSVGRWVKIGGAGAGFRFATAAVNGWARIAAIAAGKLTLDNLPAGWGTDTGTGKTIRVFFGDQIKNGVLQSSMTIERGFLGQSVPTYITNVGMEVNTTECSITSRQKITGSAAFMGLGGGKSQTPLDAAPDEVTTNPVMAANANVGRLAENGATLAAPNWAKALTFTINNNLRAIEAVDSSSPVGIVEGECTVSGRVETYFGSDTLLQKFYDGTPTSLNSRVTKNNQALVFAFPRVIYRGDGNPQAGGKNQDVMLPLSWQASKDPLTAAHVIMDRLEYYEE